jgi:hypothetical protein
MSLGGSVIRVQLKGPGTQKNVLSDVPANLSFHGYLLFLSHPYPVLVSHMLCYGMVLVMV